MKEADIVVSQWGATMVLYEFVQVLKITPKTILVRVLEKEVVGDGGYGQPQVSPCWPLRPEYEREHGLPGKTKEKRYRLFKSKVTGNWFTSVDGYRKTYVPWNGNPCTENHND